MTRVMTTHNSCYITSPLFKLILSFLVYGQSIHLSADDSLVNMDTSDVGNVHTLVDPLV